MADEGDEIQGLLDRLRAGDQEALAELFARHRERLRRMVALRLDHRLGGRVSTSDVLQEAYIDAMKRVPHFFENPDMPFFIWLRWSPASGSSRSIASTSAPGCATPARRSRSSGAIRPRPARAAWPRSLAGRLTSPSQAAIRGEMLAQLEAALDRLDPIDREVLALRHFEELSNDEVAALLGIQKAAASKRYVRALERLKEVLAEIPGSSRTTLTDATQDATRRTGRCHGDPTEPDPADPDRDPSTCWPRSSPTRYRRGERPSVERVRRAPSRAGRADPRAAPGGRADGAVEAAPPQPDTGPAGDASRPATPAPRAAGRLPDPPRDRPRRHGGRLRGGAGVARPARRAEGAPPPRRSSTPGRCSGSSREAQAAARLHHTNIVPVFGVGEHDGLPYYVMQFIHGRGLDAGRRAALRGRARVRSRTILDSHAASPRCRRPDRRSRPASDGRARLMAHWRFVARVGSQVAEALEYAHGQGVLHRDIKPSNLLLDERRARSGSPTSAWPSWHEHGDLTATGDIVGTLRYMAPERFQGESDARSDVYGLGHDALRAAHARAAVRRDEPVAADPSGGRGPAGLAPAAEPGDPPRIGGSRRSSTRCCGSI